MRSTYASVLIAVLATLLPVAGTTAAPLDTGLAAEPGEPAEFSGPRLVRVRCDRGQTLARALRKPAPELVIEFSGICRETVLIERDGVTLRGVGEEPTIREGGVSVQRAIRVNLENFRVVDSPGSGIEVFNGSQANLEGVVVSGTQARGINVRNSTASLRDIQVEGAFNVGLVIRGSHALLSGNIIANNNRLFGLSVTEGSNAFIRNADVEASHNDVGFLVQLSSSVAFVEGSLVARNNTNTGIFIAASGSLSYERITLESSDNGFLGIWMNEFATFAPFSGTASPTVLSRNGLAGVLAEKRSFVELGGGTEILDNGFGGLLVDDSSVQLTGTTVRDSAVIDISMRFGAKASFVGDGNVVGLPIQCDGSVLTRGPHACASSLAEGPVSPAWPAVRDIPRSSF